jgi:hypothetical protein
MQYSYCGLTASTSRRRWVLQGSKTLARRWKNGGQENCLRRQRWPVGRVGVLVLWVLATPPHTVHEHSQTCRNMYRVGVVLAELKAARPTLMRSMDWPR